MHLYALDEKETVVSADQAEKQKDYFCLECRSLVRRRGGFLRQLHFYHLEPNRTCRQSGKSLVHLQIQYYFQKLLADCELEKRFPSINRIADVAWEKEKLIFEMQCSPITAREIEERNRDYQSLGYQVIWILHDRLYNKNRLTAAEYFLQEWPHYFTNINSEGLGHVYDQWDLVEKGRRLKTIGNRAIELLPYRFGKDTLLKKEIPQWMHKRIRSWPLYFYGDYLDYLLKEEGLNQAEFLAVCNQSDESSPTAINQTKIGPKIKALWHFMTFPYRFTFHLIVDRLTR